MNSMSLNNIQMQKNLILFIVLVLCVSVGQLEVLDRPEDLEVAIQENYLSEVDPNLFNAKALSPTVCDGLALLASSGVKKKSDYFDEDYVLTWLALKCIWFSTTETNSVDTSSRQYKAYFSLGHLIPRHELLARYREYLDLLNQQYKLSISIA